MNLEYHRALTVGYRTSQTELLPSVFKGTAQNGVRSEAVGCAYVGIDRVFGWRAGNNSIAVNRRRRTYGETGVDDVAQAVFLRAITRLQGARVRPLTGIVFGEHKSPTRTVV